MIVKLAHKVVVFSHEVVVLRSNKLLLSHHSFLHIIKTLYMTLLRTTY